MEQQIQLDQLSMDQLKALAWDTLGRFQNEQRILNILQTEINRRSQPAPAPAPSPEPVQETEL